MSLCRWSDLVSRIEAVLRLFNTHGNRKNKNKARLKFVVRERGWEWVREEIEKNYQDILTNGGIATPEDGPGRLWWFSISTTTARHRRRAASRAGIQRHIPNPDYERWLETNIREQKQTGYAMVTVKVPQGNLTGAQMHGLAHVARNAGDGLLRVTIDQNLVLAYIPLRALPQVYSALDQIGLAEGGAHEIEDVTTCPGAYSCNLALTKSMNLGAALAGDGEGLFRSAGARAEHQDQRMSQFLRAALDRRHRILRQRAQDRWQRSSLLSDAAGRRLRRRRHHALWRSGAEHSGALGAGSRAAGARITTSRIGWTARASATTCCGTKWRRSAGMTNDLVKPPELAPEMYRDWGDDVEYSLQLGRGECAS